MFVCLLPCVAFARLGDTPQQLSDRLGAGTDITDKYAAPPNTKIYKYTRNGIGTLSFFWYGKCCQECYMNVDRTAFSDAEIQGFLTANSLGGTWTEDFSLSERGWKSGVTVDANGENVPILGATYDGHIFMCFTVKFAQAYGAALAKAGKNRIKDF